jgi:hypothetical protein
MAQENRSGRTAKSKATEPREAKEGEGGAGEAAAGLGQLREILFGAVLREIEQKLARIEVHLAARAEELQQELRRRNDALESRLQHESEALGARLEKEHASQVEAMAAAARETHEAVASIDRRLERLEEGLAQAQREGRRQLLDQARSFLDELHRVRGELTAAVERELALSRGEEPVQRDGGDRGLSASPER